jgi:hypothetical protein
MALLKNRVVHERLLCSLHSFQTCSPNDKVGVMFLCEVDLVHQPRDDVAVLQVVVVIRTENVRWNDRSEVAAVLSAVQVIQHVHHPLRIRIPWEERERVMMAQSKMFRQIKGEKDSEGETCVGLVRRTKMKHCLVDGVGGLIREDAGR